MAEAKAILKSHPYWNTYLSKPAFDQCKQIFLLIIEMEQWRKLFVLSYSRAMFPAKVYVRFMNKTSI